MTEHTLKGASVATGEGRLPRMFGKLLLLKLIAEGERGDVFAALRPVEIERFCALKILPETATRTPELVTALRAEASSLVRRIHGNVVQTFDIGMGDHRLFFVSELIEGGNLAQLIAHLKQAGKPLPAEVAVYIAMEVAAALAYLRQASERESTTAGAPLALSARSVLLSTDGEVKVAHYGATLSRAAPRTEIILPPEPTSARTPASAAAAATAAADDVYIVGDLLWQLLTGERPDPALLAASGTAPTDALMRLVRSALDTNPARRPADCDRLRTSLAATLRAMTTSVSVPATAQLRDIVRTTFAGALSGDRAELGQLVKAFDPRRELAPPTWKVITLSRTDIPGATSSGRRTKSLHDQVDLTAGKVVPGTRYRIVSKIGEGGMGTVYAAEHVDIERKVALKVLRADAAPDGETLQLFRQEARAASKIGSAYICDVTDFGEVPDGRVFFVMEYLEGESLGRVLREQAHVEPSRAIGILRQIAKALGAAHEKSIVHLDVKPDNIMLIKQGRRPDAVKVVDFGIAGLMNQSGETEEISGTPEYIAPERASGRGYDHRSDIYSLGVMAYEMLSGKVPFHGKNNVATLTMQVKDQPEPLSRRVGRRVPEALSTLVMRMLDKDPAARPQTMAETEALLCEAQIAAGLTTAWDHLELPAIDEEWRARLERRMPTPGRRARRTIIGAATGVALVAVAVVLYVGFIRKPQVIVKEVRVELTNTDEAPAVALALLKADQAARRQRYVRPVDDSALHYIINAENEASRTGRRSAGAQALRRAYASGLAVIGNELLKAGLRDLALPKYKEALLFLPEDRDLQLKAELPPEDSHARERRQAAASAPLPAQTSADNAKEAATKVFLAATQGRLSEARLALKMLAEFDSGGVQRARLSDGLRTRASAEWNVGHKENARSLYQLISELDPQDLDARERAKAEAPAAPAGPSEIPPGTAATPPPSPTPAAAAAASAPAKVKKKEAEAETDLPRDPVASKKAAEAGLAAMTRGRLGEAEQSFNRAVRADAQNPIAVGGLADVAFERARYTEALDYGRRASRLAPKNTKYLVLVGDAYFKLLRYDEAMTNYQKARTLAPTDETIKSRIEKVSAKLSK
ncbi:MAG: eukaryotic-like serine/threonine-protein kinase [Myxococcales bacterium]|nr:eukaryotic-like serine/threonine-protein kinase [Myxococcales bacterium]